MWLSCCLDHFGSLLLGLPCNDGQNEHLFLRRTPKPTDNSKNTKFAGLKSWRKKAGKEKTSRWDWSRNDIFPAPAPSAPATMPLASPADWSTVGSSCGKYTDSIQMDTIKKSCHIIYCITYIYIIYIRWNLLVHKGQKRCKAMGDVKQSSATPNESILYWNRSEQVTVPSNSNDNNLLWRVISPRI